MQKKANETADEMTEKRYIYREADRFRQVIEHSNQYTYPAKVNSVNSNLK